MAEISEDIGRGHAEVLMGQIESCLQEADVTYDDLTRLAVTIGPGSFTGVRVGMATAKGLGLGLSVPMVGISTLDAAEKHAQELGTSGPISALLDAKRDQAFCKLPGEAPSVFLYEELTEKLARFDGVLCGSGAAEFLNRSGASLEVVHHESAAPIACIARLAMDMPISGEGLEPLYLRSADAKKQTGFALPRVGA